MHAKHFRSMFAYCTEKLNLSEHEAYLRITVGRASRKHPVLLTMLGEGRLHLSGIAKLVPHLTDANRETLLAQATDKSKREIEELVVELAPQPDVPARIRKLPEPQLGPDRVVSPKPAGLRPVEPLAPARYKIQFTGNAQLKEKLERLQALRPNGDLAAMIEEAVTEKPERLESKRFGKTKIPRKNLEQTDTSPSSRYIPAAVKRAVSERDGNRCAYVDSNGRRCAARDGLQFHHDDPYARGGDHSPDNIAMMCPTHNAYLAECDYGKEAMKRYSRSREPAPVYASTT